MNKKRPAIITAFMTMALIWAIVISSHAADHHIIMKIEGMNCDICPLAVKKSLMEVEGVKAVIHSPDNENTLIVADESTSAQLLINAVKKAGSYTPAILEGNINGCTQVTSTSSMSTDGQLSEEGTEIRRMSSEELMNQLNKGEKTVIIDVRSVNSYKLQHITGSISIPFKEIASRLDEFSPDQDIVFY